MASLLTLAVDGVLDDADRATVAGRFAPVMRSDAMRSTRRDQAGRAACA